MLAFREMQNIMLSVVIEICCPNYLKKMTWLTLWMWMWVHLLHVYNVVVETHKTSTIKTMK